MAKAGIDSDYLDFQHLCFNTLPRPQLLQAHSFLFSLILFFGWTTTRRELLLKALTFFISLILFFQSKTNQNVLVAQAGIDPSHVRFQHLASEIESDRETELLVQQQSSITECNNCE